jgi:hypothetical protein
VHHAEKKMTACLLVTHESGTLTKPVKHRTACRVATSDAQADANRVYRPVTGQAAPQGHAVKIAVQAVNPTL